MLTFLVVLAVAAIIPAAIAHSKGRNFFLWWVYGVALWIFALIHSILLKPRRSCPHCAEVVKVEATVCPHCQRDIGKWEALVQSDLKRCPNCGDPILLNATSCRWCAKPV